MNQCCPNYCRWEDRGGENHFLYEVWISENSGGRYGKNFSEEVMNRETHEYGYGVFEPGFNIRIFIQFPFKNKAED